MPGQIDVIFKLAGPLAGATQVIDKNKPFVKGYWRTWVAHQHYEGLVNKLAGGYNAHPLGSPALLAAEAAWENRSGGPIRIQAGASEHVPTSVSGGGLRLEPERHADASPNILGVAGPQFAPVGEGLEGNSVSGRTEERSAGRGLSDGLLPDGAGSAPQPDSRVRSAVEALDPENDRHWVATGANAGKPRVDVVAQAAGIEGLTRVDLDAAWPDWTREKAKAAAEVKPEEV